MILSGSAVSAEKPLPRTKSFSKNGVHRSALNRSLIFPKSLIAAAIYQQLMDNPTCDRYTDLEIAYVQLESFIPDVEYCILSEFKNADKLALELAATGGPANVLAAVRLLKKAKGDIAVMIQERISQKMQGRLQQIGKLCSEDRLAFS